MEENKGPTIMFEVRRGPANINSMKDKHFEIVTMD